MINLPILLNRMLKRGYVCQHLGGGVLRFGVEAKMEITSEAQPEGVTDNLLEEEGVTDNLLKEEGVADKRSARGAIQHTYEDTG